MRNSGDLHRLSEWEKIKNPNSPPLALIGLRARLPVWRLCKKRLAARLSHNPDHRIWASVYLH